MKTLIGIPCMNMVHTRFVSSLMGMHRVGETHVDFNIGSLVYDARNQFVIEAIEQKADRILMIDSDMRFDPDMMERLSKDMEVLGCDMVTALAFRRRKNTEPVIFSNVEPPKIGEDGIPRTAVKTFYDYPQDALFRVDGCGTGCVMMTTDLAKRVWDRFGPPFAPFNWCGEDISFCWRVKQLGAQIYCDSEVKVGHIGDYEYGEADYSRKGGQE